MESNDSISNQIRNLSLTRSNLIKEKNEYIKYKNYFEDSIINLFRSNKKLLRSLKERYIHFYDLHKRYNEIEENFNEKQNLLKIKNDTKHIIDAFSNKTAKKNQIMKATIHLSRSELRQVYNKYLDMKDQIKNIELYNNEIERLKMKKKKEQEEKEKLQKEIDDLEDQFDNNYPLNALDGLSELYSKLIEMFRVCNRLEKDKISFENIQEQNIQNNKNNQIQPGAVLNAFDINLNSNVSTEHLSTLCESSSESPSKNISYFYNINLSANSVKQNKAHHQRNSTSSTFQSDPQNKKEDVKPVIEKRKKEMIKKLMKNNKSKPENEENTTASIISSLGQSPIPKQNQDETNKDIVNEENKPNISHKKRRRKRRISKKNIQDNSELSSASYSTKSSQSTSTKNTSIQYDDCKSSNTKENQGNNKKNVTNSYYVYDSYDYIDYSPSINSSQQDLLENESYNNSSSSKTYYDSESRQTTDSHKHNKKKRKHKFYLLESKKNINQNDSSASASSTKKSYETDGNSNVKIRSRKNEDNKENSTRSSIQLDDKSSQQNLDSGSFTKTNDSTINTKPAFDSLSSSNLPHDSTNFLLKMPKAFPDKSQDIYTSQSLFDSTDSNFLVELSNKFSQTDRSIMTYAIILLKKKLERFKFDDTLNESILDAQSRLDDIENDILSINRELKIKNKKHDDLISSFKFENNIETYDINYLPPTQTLEASCQTIEIPPIEILKNMIINNSRVNPRGFLMKTQQRDLMTMMQQKRLELKITKMSNRRKQIDIDSLLKRLKIVDPLLYSSETHEPSQIYVDPIILDKKQRKVDKMNSLVLHIQDNNTESELLEAQISDQQFMIEKMTNDLMCMAQKPKSNVQTLCNSIKQDKSVINENLRQNSFAQLEIESVEKSINRYKEICSDKSLELMHQRIESMSNYLFHLKNRFNTLRAVQEKRSIVLTCEEDLLSLQKNIVSVLSEIDVYRMRINGVISKIEKQIRSILSQRIRYPEPPKCLFRQGTSPTSP